MSKSCPFCKIIAGHAPAAVLHEDHHAIVIKPIDPVTPGHVLVIPREHVPDFTEDPTVAAKAMRTASNYAADAGLGACNLITSRGRPATQSVFHLHLHVVPRATGDGLALPWYSGRGGMKRLDISTSMNGYTEDEMIAALRTLGVDVDERRALVKLVADEAAYRAHSRTAALRATEAGAERDGLYVALDVVTEALDRVITERDQLKTTVGRVGRLRDRWKRWAVDGRRDLGADMAYLALTVELGEWPKP